MRRDEDLRAYVDRWLDRFPDERASSAANAGEREADAKWLDRFVGRTDYSRKQIYDLIDWKFRSRWLYRTNARKGVDAGWPKARTRIREAFRLDDEAALYHLLGARGGIPSVGPAMASVFLMAHDPARFTIADVWALASVRSLGLLPPGPQGFRASDWMPYLSACRSLHDRTGRSLREIDQALWAAKGRAGTATS
jgi:hypothetical protein